MSSERKVCSLESYLEVAPIDVAGDHPATWGKTQTSGWKVKQKLIRTDWGVSLAFSLTMSAGGSLKAVGLGRGVLPEEVAVGRPDRLVWDELVVLGKLSPSPRSSSSRGGEALVIPGWVSWRRGRDSGRDSSPSRPAFWLFCLSSAVAPLSPWTDINREDWTTKDCTAHCKSYLWVWIHNNWHL